MDRSIGLGKISARALLAIPFALLMIASQPFGCAAPEEPRTEEHVADGQQALNAFECICETTMSFPGGPPPSTQCYSTADMTPLPLSACCLGTICAGGQTCQDYDCDGIPHCADPGEGGDGSVSGGPGNCCTGNDSCGAGFSCCTTGSGQRKCLPPDASACITACPPPISANPGCGDQLEPGGPLCDANGQLLPTSQPAVSDCIGSPASQCDYYLSLTSCFDCGPCEQTRLQGYFQTCRNMGQIADGSFPGLNPSYSYCASDCSFLQYVSEMRRCLQESTEGRVGDNPGMSCSDLVNGDPTGVDPTTGIIGAHTPCNADSGFCDLSIADRACFAYGLGDSWGPACPGGGGFTPGGSFTSVGICHMLSEMATCIGAGANPIDFWDGLCAGYQDGCMNTDPCSYFPQDLGCALACPRPGQIADLISYLAPLGAAADPALQATVNGLTAMMQSLGALSPDNLAGLEAVCNQFMPREGCSPTPALEEPVLSLPPLAP